MKKILCVFLLLLNTAIALTAQTVEINNTVEMADKFRADGKIFVVVAVVCVILLGIFAYIIKTERKIHRLEKEIEERKSK
jgi:CcmD family protein